MKTLVNPAPSPQSIVPSYAKSAGYSGRCWIKVFAILIILITAANLLVSTHSPISNKAAAAPQSPRENVQHLAFVGTVTSVNQETGTFMLATNKGARLIRTTSATVFQTVGGTSFSLTDLSISDYIGVLGELSADTHEVTAIQVIKAAQAPSGKRQAVYGIVVGKDAIGGSGALLTVSHPTNGTKREVSVTSRTKITTRGATNASIADILANNRIVAVGTVDERGVIEAERLYVIPGNPKNP